MSEFKKFGFVQKSAGTAADMTKINAQALRDLTPEEVFTFRIAAADDQVDRDYERFTKEALEQMAKLYVGRTIIMDHDWAATKQTARIYDAYTAIDNGVIRLILCSYMLRNDATAPIIQAIEGGILREVSVFCAVSKCVCSICGADKARFHCMHRPGKTYEDILCVVSLEEVVDAYECSFVAVPSQRQAGVTKAYGGEDGPEAGNDVKNALALLELEALNT